MTASSAKICSLDELEIELPDDIRSFLRYQYQHQQGQHDGTTHDKTLSLIVAAMKRPPASTVCRINRILTTREEVEVALEDVLKPYPHLHVLKHNVFDDVLCILPRISRDGQKMNYNAKVSVPVPAISEVNNNPLFSGWPSRKEKGWPMTHRVVLCDRFCGEAVLRGSDIFVRGILAADANIQAGETVAVYADIRGPNETAVSRGLLLDRYLVGRCVFLGLGTSACSRNEFFRSSHGVGIVMSKNPSQRVGPCLPPLSGILQDKMMLQNLPSILVAHALDPQPNDTILDMCAAPGGKSAHLASLVKNQATIVSCDKSRKKVLASKELFSRLGATCITPLVLDATKCVHDDNSVVVSDDNKGPRRTSIQQVRLITGQEASKL